MLMKKTKIIIYKKPGCESKNKINFKYKYKKIEVGKKYTYLGIYINS